MPDVDELMIFIDTSSVTIMESLELISNFWAVVSHLGPVDVPLKPSGQTQT